MHPIVDVYKRQVEELGKFLPLTLVVVVKNAYPLAVCTPVKLAQGVRRAQRVKVALAAELRLVRDDTHGVAPDAAGEERGVHKRTPVSYTHLRLKNVMQPPMKAGGALAIGLAVFFMLLCFGQVALAYGGGVGRDVIFNAHELSKYSLEDEPSADEEALIEYLASLELRELTGSYDFDTFNARHRGFRFEGPQGGVYVGLYDNAVEVLIYRCV